MPGQFDFSAFPILETERLRLRQIVIEDAPQVLEMFNHPEVMKFKGMDVFPDQALAESWIRWMGKQYADESALRWGITFKGEDRVIESFPLL